MIKPEMMSQIVGVTTDSLRAPMYSVVGVRAGFAASAEAAIPALCIAAKGTPTKFTKSLPANAKAKANVPAKITIRSTLKFQNQIRIWKTTVIVRKKLHIRVSVFASSHAISAGVMKEAPFAPLTIRK